MKTLRCIITFEFISLNQIKLGFVVIISIFECNFSQSNLEITNKYDCTLILAIFESIGPF